MSGVVRSARISTAAAGAMTISTAATNTGPAGSSVADSECHAQAAHWWDNPSE
jgi:hypothetical protein